MKELRPPSFSVRAFRIIAGLIQFLWVVFVAFSDYLVRYAFRRANGPTVRAVWLQRHSRRALGIFKLRMRVAGPVPAGGLLVSNHLSYLDILVISSIVPAVFVAKREVKSWPVLGRLAQLAGTLFVDRERRTQVGEMTGEIQAALDLGALVVLFPEGTSSDGSGVLPFKSALLEPAARRTHPLCVACIQYALDDGDAASEICYWGDHTFFPHLLHLLGHRGFSVCLQLAPIGPVTGDRKELARQLRAEVLKLKETSPAGRAFDRLNTAKPG